MTPNDIERLMKKQSGPESISTNGVASTSEGIMVPKTSMKERSTNTSSISFRKIKKSTEITNEWSKQKKTRNREKRAMNGNGVRHEIETEHTY